MYTNNICTFIEAYWIFVLLDELYLLEGNLWFMPIDPVIIWNVVLWCFDSCPTGEMSCVLLRAWFFVATFHEHFGFD